MRLRSFTANSLPEAMRRVRDVLGPEAIILSTQPAEDGHGVRVTAALENSPLEPLTHVGATGDATGGATGAAVSMDEISEALTYHRVPPALFDRLIGAAAALTAKNDALALGGALDGEFILAAPPEAPTPRPFLLVGPPGAGKTATAAKLCARVRLAGGRASLITMDTVRSGGLAQVTAFAQALGAELLQAPDIDALVPAIEAVFGAGDAQDMAIPYRIADRSTMRRSPVAEAFMALLELLSGRATRSELLDWLSLAASTVP